MRRVGKAFIISISILILAIVFFIWDNRQETKFYEDVFLAQNIKIDSFVVDSTAYNDLDITLNPRDYWYEYLNKVFESSVEGQRTHHVSRFIIEGRVYSDNDDYLCELLISRKENGETYITFYKPFVSITLIGPSWIIDEELREFTTYLLTE